jgi:2-polyprenyl-3-methyl-5-hydroxy-6-metoxy-1,4-benzoquinol methylase
MINEREAPAQIEVDALMARVRDAIDRQRTSGTALPPPVSLDGIVRRQTELNDAVVRAIALFSNQIAGLKQACDAAAARPAVEAPSAELVTHLENRLAAVEESTERLSRREALEAAPELEQAASVARSAQRGLASLVAKLERAARNRVRTERRRNERLAALETKLEQLNAMGASLQQVADSLTPQFDQSGQAIAALASQLSRIEQTAAADAERIHRELAELSDRVTAATGIAGDARHRAHVAAEAVHAATVSVAAVDGQWRTAVADLDDRIRQSRELSDSAASEAAGARAAAEQTAREAAERAAVVAHDAQARGEKLAADLDAQSHRIDAVAERMAHISETADAARQRAATALAHFDVVEEKTTARFDEMRMRVLRAERAVREERGQAAASDVVGGAAPRKAPAFDYFMFEHRFRGTGDDIRRRQTKYLELFAGRQNVLDLGCGRGEFLEIALEHGITASGVDSSDDMVAFCHDRGLPAVRSDLFAYLEGLPERSLDGIFCAQVIEHLQPDDIGRLIDLAAMKLRPGSPMVLETVNPHCPLALGNFFLDPTHVRPVPPLMLKFMLEQSLFTVDALRFLSPVPGHEGPAIVQGRDPVPAESHAYQDYAAVAVR